MINDTFYSEEPVIGHHVSATYEKRDSVLLDDTRHRITIEEGDVDWSDTKSVKIAPELLFEIAATFIESHEDDYEELIENRGLYPGLEKGMEITEFVSNDD